MPSKKRKILEQQRLEKEKEKARRLLYSELCEMFDTGIYYTFSLAFHR